VQHFAIQACFVICRFHLKRLAHDGSDNHSSLHTKFLLSHIRNRENIWWFLLTTMYIDYLNSEWTMILTLFYKLMSKCKEGYRKTTAKEQWHHEGQAISIFNLKRKVSARRVDTTRASYCTGGESPNSTYPYITHKYIHLNFEITLTLSRCLWLQGTLILFGDSPPVH
jgi:hypothetical protein